MYNLIVFFASSALVSALPQASDAPLTGCATEVTACEQRYLTSIHSATFDRSANCLAATALESCLSQREALLECQSALPQIASIKQTYDDSLNSPQCSTPEAKACAQNVFSCTQTYNTQMANSTAACQAANSYLVCLGGVVCNSPGVRLEMVRGFAAIKRALSAGGQNCTFVASALSAATDCTADVMKCESDFKAAANTTGDDVTASCNVAATFLACLDNKDNSQECSSVKQAIATLRSSYAAQIKALGCSSIGPAGAGPLKCSKDIQDCQQRFIVDNTKAGDDNTKACQAGEALGNCLFSIETRPECGGAKKIIDSIRGSYHDQINTQGCASIIRPQQTQCQKDVVTCEQTFQNAIKATPNNAVAQCNAGVVFMSCLDQYDHKVECLAAQSAIASMRALFSTQIAAAGCGTGVKPTVTPCQGDVMGCVQAFVDAVKIAGNNVDKQCSAGATLTKCFDDKNKAPECAAVKGTIATLRNTFSSQIRTDGCVGNVDPNDKGVKCSLDITDCEETFQTQVNDAGTDIKSQCSAGATLEACLSQVEQNSDCSGAKKSVDAVKNMYQQQIDQTAC
ncbi:hypothetical protein EGW08_020723, partial [Elysia chlorotica]